MSETAVGEELVHRVSWQTARGLCGCPLALAADDFTTIQVLPQIR